MRLLIKPLMPRPSPAFKLHSGPGRLILDVLEVNNLLKRITRISKTLKRISFPRILLLMHYQAGPNPHWHSLRKNKIVIFAEDDPDNRAKARIPLSLTLTSLLSERTRTKIKTRRTSPILSATFVSRKNIIPTNALRRSQKTSVGLDNLHIDD